MSGTISQSQLKLDGATILQEHNTLLQSYPKVGISLELPIVKECFFQTDMIVNNVLLVPNYVGLKIVEKHSAKMKAFESIYYPKFEELNTLHNIKNSANYDVFNKYAKEHFDRDETEISDTPNKMRLGLVNLYEQLFKHIRHFER